MEWKKTSKRCEQSLRISLGATDVSVEHIPINWKYSTRYLAVLTLEIWFPVKRPSALLPVRSASTWAPPFAFSNLLQSSVVDVSCHIETLWNENAAGHNCLVRSWLSFKLARSWFALIIQSVYRTVMQFFSSEGLNKSFANETHLSCTRNCNDVTEIDMIIMQPFVEQIASTTFARASEAIHLGNREIFLFDLDHHRYETHL